MKLLHAIQTHAESYPQTDAFRSQGQSLTYQELWEQSDRAVAAIQNAFPGKEISYPCVRPYGALHDRFLLRKRQSGTSLYSG